MDVCPSAYVCEGGSIFILQLVPQPTTLSLGLRSVRFTLWHLRTQPARSTSAPAQLEV